MRGTFGAFKGLHAGRGIYWAGTFNVEGNGEYKSILQARTAIDQMNARWAAADLAARQEKAASGEYLVVRRFGEGRVVETPDGPVEFATMRAFRQGIFGLEEKYGREIVSLSDEAVTA